MRLWSSEVLSLPPAVVPAPLGHNGTAECLPPKTKLSFWPPASGHHTQQSGDAPTTQEQLEIVKKEEVSESSLFLQIQTEAFFGPRLLCYGVSEELLSPSLSFPFHKVRTKIHTKSSTCMFTAASFAIVEVAQKSRNSSNVYQLRNR